MSGLLAFGIIILAAFLWVFIATDIDLKLYSNKKMKKLVLQEKRLTYQQLRKEYIKKNCEELFLFFCGFMCGMIFLWFGMMHWI